MSSDYIEEAIIQLQDLGITRKQAINALARYNYDVTRAADYIFSGNALDSDGDEQELSNAKEWSGWDDEPNDRQDVADSWNTTKHTALTGVEKDDENESTKFTEMTHARSQPISTSSSTSVQYDPDMWSLVPVSAPADTNKILSGPASSEPFSRNSLTWWTDPEDPSMRALKPNVPAGLRPPSYNFAYAPVIIQALYHISLFRYAVLSFRPLPYAWGSPRNYWKGYGETIPGYYMKAYSRPVTPIQAPESQSTNPFASDLGQENRANEATTPDQQVPVMSEGAGGSIVEEMNLVVMPQCTKVLAELQKLFAFMGNTHRLYGSVAHLTRALDSRSNANQWSSNETSTDGFIETLLSLLVQADKYADAEWKEKQRTFHSLFSLKARVEFGDEVDEEEVFYLTLGTNKNRLSFHDCLGPLVYQSYQQFYSNGDSDVGSVNSDSTTDTSRYKFSMFDRLPPILIATLEIRDGRDPRKSAPADKYRVEKTIYMDRYLTENKEKALKNYRQAEEWKAELANAAAEMKRLRRDSVYGKQKYDKMTLLDDTLKYFENKTTTAHLDDPANATGVLFHVIELVKKNISTRLEELERIEQTRKTSIRALFDTPDLQKHPYDLRATLHHDGLNGTGHYWAYIFVESNEENLLQDIPNDTGGWFKFCDASVTPVTESEVFNDPVSPLVVIYNERGLPNISNDALQSAIPDNLKLCIDEDNTHFSEEIHQFNTASKTPEPPSTSVLARLDGDDDATFDEEGSTGTAVGVTAMDDDDTPEPRDTPATTSDMQEDEVPVALFNSYDYRFLKSFDVYVARLGHKPESSASSQDAEEASTVNAPRNDPLREHLWQGFEALQEVGKSVTKGMTLFKKEEYREATQFFLIARHLELKWKTLVLSDPELAGKPSVVDSISFAPVTETLGKVAIKRLNENAYSKATNPSYRTRGLEEGIFVVQTAFGLVDPENPANHAFFGDLQEQWMAFSESQGASLQQAQGDLLNELIMSFLEHPSEPDVTKAIELLDMHEKGDPSNVPFWEEYRQLLDETFVT